MTGRKEALTIRQVAIEAGVARSSVSRAFTRPEMLKPETVKRIHEAAERLGYVPNHAARALSTGKHGNLALIVPDVANPFFPPMIRAAQIEAERFDFCVFLGNSDENPTQEDRLLGRLSGQVEGLVIASSRMSDGQIRTYAGSRPVVLINRDVAGIPRILIDSGAGVSEAVAHLAEHGHQKIVYVSGPPNSWSNKQRKSAVRSSAQKFGVEVQTVAATVPSFAAGRNAVSHLMTRGATAVIAFDDLMAQGILVGLAEQHVTVPDQFSVVGCDDVLGATTYPMLTSVSNRASEAGRAAVGLLMEMLQSHAIRDVRYVLETHLVVRNTTGPARLGKS